MRPVFRASGERGYNEARAQAESPGPPGIRIRFSCIMYNSCYSEPGLTLTISGASWSALSLSWLQVVITLLSAGGVVYCRERRQLGLFFKAGAVPWADADADAMV
jgi:hypothetical protein